MTFTNLDELRAESKSVKFLGKDFEVGYIPSGLAIPLLEQYNNDVKNQKETDSQEKLLNDAIRFVSLFCSHYESEFTEEYLKRNATDKQLDAMRRIIFISIIENFSEVADETNKTQKKTIGQN